MSENWGDTSPVMKDKQGNLVAIKVIFGNFFFYLILVFRLVRSRYRHLLLMLLQTQKKHVPVVRVLLLDPLPNLVTRKKREEWALCAINVLQVLTDVLLYKKNDHKTI